MKPEADMKKIAKEEKDPGAVEEKISPVRMITFLIVSVLWVIPIVITFYNSFKQSGKVSSDIFSLPTGDSFVFFEN